MARSLTSARYPVTHAPTCLGALGSLPVSADISGAFPVLKTSKSKNDPSARGPAQQAKSFEGKKIKPVLYVGTAIGHGRYIAAQDESGKMILDRGGKPVPYRLI